jgi:hypothetical protein
LSEEFVVIANNYLMERLGGIQQILTSQHEAGRGMPSAMKGTERETLVSKFLERVFPSQRRFSTGCITDANGTRTGQVDILVEYGFFPSFPTPNAEPRLILAEGVAAAIEVKSDLIAQWGEVTDKVLDVKSINRHLFAQYGEDPSQKIPMLAVGYEGHATADSLTNRMETTEVSRRPDAALVIKSGAFSSPELTAEGPEGLYAFCVYLTEIFQRIGFAEADLFRYVSTNTRRGRRDLDKFFS